MDMSSTKVINTMVSFSVITIIRMLSVRAPLDPYCVFLGYKVSKKINWELTLILLFVRLIETAIISDIIDDKYVLDVALCSINYFETEDNAQSFRSSPINKENAAMRTGSIQ